MNGLGLLIILGFLPVNGYKAYIILFGTGQPSIFLRLQVDERVNGLSKKFLVLPSSKK